MAKDERPLRGRANLLDVGAEGAGEDLIEFDNPTELQAKIRVIGVGGAGGNALNSMIRSELQGVDFIAANTDAQALGHSQAKLRVQLGVEVTRGLGCGADPTRGRAAALEDRDKLSDLLVGSDMVFVTAGLGGGTGTGAAPVIAEVAREVGALTVGVVTKPFPFEGRQRAQHAEQGICDLQQTVDTLITIPNQRLLALAGKDTPMLESFKLADDVLLNAVKGISDLITQHGLINLDFADVRTIMNEMGMALMGTGIGSGENSAKDAAFAAISSPLLEDISIAGARGVLINITGNPEITLFDVNEAMELVQESAHEDANIITGAVIDEEMPSGEVRVTVIATGLDDKRTRVGERRVRRSDDPPLRPRSGGIVPAPGLDLPAAPSAERAGPATSAEATGDKEAQPETLEELEELDVPTYIRRRGNRDELKEEDTEQPTFLRRQAD